MRKMLRKSDPNFQHYVQTIEAQAKIGFLIKKRVLMLKTLSFTTIVQSCKVQKMFEN